MMELGTNHIILDAYNANPSSMKLAIENFAKLNAPKKVVLLGAMAELGDESMDEHKALIDLLQQYPWEKVVLVGGDFLKIQHPFLSFPSSEEAASWMKLQSLEHTYILIKGSRSMKMEKIIA
jgi:UDP-N-acetylmuramoyl-tripeptide--D-alanyl-D-alanine ligase